MTNYDNVKLESCKHVHPKYLVAAFNPRRIEELEYQSLTPAIEQTNGVLLEAILAWQPPADWNWEKHAQEHCFHNLVSGEEIGPPPVEERSKCFIIVRGHRRTAVAQDLLADPDTGQATADNLKRLPVFILDGNDVSEEAARAIARDEEGKMLFSKYNIIKMVFDMYARGMTYNDVVLDMPETLYRHFRSNARRKWSEVARMDVKEREAAIKTDLRNDLFTNLYNCYACGPAIVDMRLKTQEAKEFGRKDLFIPFEITQVIMAGKKDVPSLGKIFAAEKDPLKWLPITDLGYTDDKSAIPTGDHVTTKVKKNETFYVVGGNENARNFIIEHMIAKRHGTKVESATPKVKSASDVGDLIKTVRSEGIRLALQKVFEGDSPGSLPEVDTAILAWEEREKILKALPPQHELVQQAINTLLSSRNATNITDAFVNISKALEAKETNGRRSGRKAAAAKS